MIFLGIDTSTGTASAAVGDRHRVRETVIGDDYRQSAMIVGTIHQLLRDGGMAIGDIHGVVCVAGPGSFTGLRVGMCTAKALSYSTGRPMFSVSSLECMAWQVAKAGYSGNVCIMMDARNDQVYMGCYRIGPDTEPCALMGDTAGSIVELLPQALELCGAECILAGTGVYAHMDMVQQLPGVTVVPDIHRPAAWAAVAIGEFMAGSGRNVNPVTAAPQYLRQSQAERSKQAGTKP